MRIGVLLAIAFVAEPTQVTVPALELLATLELLITLLELIIMLELVGALELDETTELMLLDDVSEELFTTSPTLLLVTRLPEQAQTEIAALTINNFLYIDKDLQ